MSKEFNETKKQREYLFNRLIDLQIDVVNTIAEIVDLQTKTTPEKRDEMFLVGINTFISKIFKIVQNANWSYCTMERTNENFTLRD